MIKSPLFSTYRQGENRVTSSMMAVFERIDLGVVERLLREASGESSLSIVAFSNQLAARPGSVPDAAITARCRYLFEVKTARGALRIDQLRAHASSLDGSFGDERLFIITPDADRPATLDQMNDSKIVWFNFQTLSQAIDELLSDRTELLPEQTRFLLSELQALFEQDGLLGYSDTVVVAARVAWSEYLKYGAYICQPNRSFREGVAHFAFYTDGEIKPYVPRIILRQDSVNISSDTGRKLTASDDPAEREVGEIVQSLIAEGARAENSVNQVFILSKPDDSRTLRLPAPIRNTKRDHKGKPWAWTLSQGYTQSAILAKGPQTTEELERLGG